MVRGRAALWRDEVQYSPTTPSVPPQGTIFAYGQTGTGKTFTMAGLKDVPESRGIIPNSFAHIFGHIAKCGEGVQ